jgi:hypothetical protein
VLRGDALNRAGEDAAEKAAAGGAPETHH